MLCPKCKQDTLTHLHSEAHGISGTHMSGSERFECECGFHVGSASEAKEYNLEFILDKEE